MKKLLWHLIGGTRGGVNRARILAQLKERPYNPNQLAQALELDYKTVVHHLRVLTRNELVFLSREEMSTLYFLTTMMQNHWEEFQEIWEKLGQK